MPRMRRIAAALTLALATLPTLAVPEPPRVIILGDSIAHDGRWTSRVESALRGTPTYADATILNLALPSETVSGLSEPGHAGGAYPRPCLHDRLGEVLRQTKPDLVIACYGMNDGLYQPFDGASYAAFKRGMERLVAAVRATGARIILLTPPPHAPDKSRTSAQDYDNVLEAYSGWLISQSAMGWEVIDIRPAVRNAVDDEKAANPAFRYAVDNVHPGELGHRAIADATLAGLWPMLKLAEKPDVGSPDRLKAIGEAQQILKLAWLSQTGHKRPGIPKGQPLEVAQKKAAELLTRAKSL